MELGQKIRQARLETGLSQRQLCGDTITRNMLSLIENGSAQPSMDTLRFLAQGLNKPVGYFLEEDTVSPNQACILAARGLPEIKLTEALKNYKAPDVVFDPEYYLLMALGAMALAEKAIEEDRLPLAGQYLAQAQAAGQASMYYGPELEQRRLLLCHRAKTDTAANLAAMLPDRQEETLLRAEAALEEKAYSRCAALLDGLSERDDRWYFLRGESCLGLQQYNQAAQNYLCIENQDASIYSRLEACYREQGDFEKAYYYVRKQFEGK